MNDIPSLSVIIPIYNTGAYLEQCLQSVSHNRPSNCELVLVDDGSTDNSHSICKNFVARHSQVTLIVQENRGLSAARNAGVLAAHGEFLAFLDSDDMIDMESVQRLLIQAQEHHADVVQGNMLLFQADGWKNIHSVGRMRQYLEKSSSMAICAFMFEPVWAVQRLYRRSFLAEHNILFDVRLRIHEDFDFTFKVAKNVPVVISVDEIFYSYRTDVPTCITHISNEKILAVFHIWECMGQELKKTPPAALAFVRLLLFCYSKCGENTRDAFIDEMSSKLLTDFCRSVKSGIPLFNDYYSSWGKIRYSNAIAMFCFRHTILNANSGRARLARLWMNIAVETSIRGDLVQRLRHPVSFLKALVR